MNEVIVVAVIVALSTSTTPLLLAFLQGRERRREKASEYVRQDLIAKRARDDAKAITDRQDDAKVQADIVAAQAASAAQLLIESNERVALVAEESVRAAAETARIAAETARVAEASAKATDKQLRVIHTLVNSQMTAAIEAELGATVTSLAMMKEVLELKSHDRQHQPTNGAQKRAIEMTEDRIADLKNRLLDRERAMAELQTQGSEVMKT